MISIERRFFFIDLIDVYLEEEYKIQRSKRKLVVHHYSKVPGTKLFEEITYKINLEKDESELLQDMSKTNRYKLRRAEKQPYEYIVKDSPTDNDLKEFQLFYNEFVKIKKTNTINNYRLNRLKHLRNKGVLIFTKLQNTNGEALGYQIHIRDKDLVLNYYTCTAAWIKDRPDLNQQINFANRYLLWKNMLLFKNRGYKIYDFGGITDVHEINKFKEEFGFLRVKTYHGLEAKSFIGKVLIKLHWMKFIYLF